MVNRVTDGAGLRHSALTFFTIVGSVNAIRGYLVKPAFGEICLILRELLCASQGDSLEERRA